MSAPGFSVAEIQARSGTTGALSSFESGNYSSRRSRVPGAAPSDFKHDFSDYVRLETLRRSRYTMRNSGLPREHRDMNWLYGVGGGGLVPQSMSPDEDFRKASEAAFKEWSKRADVTGRFSFATIQKLVSFAVDTDGEIFAAKVIKKNGARRLQLIESHRVGNYGTQSPRWIDGIKVSASGEPTHIMTQLENGSGKAVPMSSVMHIFNAESASAYRHVPFLAHSVNHMLDEGELLALEMSTMKAHSDISHVLTRSGGSFDSSGDFSTNPAGSEGDGTDPAALQRLLGGKMVAIDQGEKLQSESSQRPSPTFTGYIEHGRRDASLGSLPYGFAVDASGEGGPAIRLSVAKASRRFSARTDLIANELVIPTWFWVIGDMIARGELKAAPDWWKISVGGVKDITVDAGRDNESNRRDVAEGLKLPTTSYTEQGSDFLESMEQKARLIESVKKIAKDRGIDDYRQLFNFDPSNSKQSAGGKAGTPPSGDAKKKR